MDLETRLWTEQRLPPDSNLREFRQLWRPVGSAPPDTGFELRHLRYFVAVAEALHFGRAARMLNMSQPPLSRQIQDLERCLGTKLFKRSARSVILTEAGKVFLVESNRILAQACRSVQMVRRALAGEAGRLEVGVSDFFDSSLVCLVRDVVALRYPDVQISFHRHAPEEQIHLLRSGTLDAGLFTLPADTVDHLKIEQLFRLPAVALVAGQHRLTACKEISLRDLRHENIVEIQSDFAPRPFSHVDRISRLCGILLRVGRHAPNLQRLLEDVQDRGLVGLTPSCVGHSAGSEYRSLPIVERDADFTFGVAYCRDRDDLLLTRFLETTRELSLNHLRSRNSLDQIPLAS